MKSVIKFYSMEHSIVALGNLIIINTQGEKCFLFSFSNNLKEQKVVEQPLNFFIKEANQL